MNEKIKAFAKTKQLEAAAHALCDKLRGAVRETLMQDGADVPVSYMRVGDMYVNSHEVSRSSVDRDALKTFLAEHAKDLADAGLTQESFFRSKEATQFRLGKEYGGGEMATLTKALKDGAANIEDAYARIVGSPMEPIGNDRDEQLLGLTQAYAVVKTVEQSAGLELERQKQELMADLGVGKHDGLSILSVKAAPSLDRDLFVATFPDAELPKKTTSSWVCEILDQRLYDMRMSFSQKHKAPEPDNPSMEDDIEGFSPDRKRHV